MDRLLRAPAHQGPLQELEAGIAFWRTKLDANWPADFHNADYKKWATETRDFSDAWWTPFLRRLHDWIAIRPATYSEVTARFVQRRRALSEAWAMNCAPSRDLDITGVSWAQVGAVADLVGEIKPMKGLASPVFTSKFCHFLLPKVFPVVDNEGSGNRWPRYQQYFNHVQSLWETTPDETRASLIAAMAKLSSARERRPTPGSRWSTRSSNCDSSAGAIPSADPPPAGRPKQRVTHPVRLEDQRWS